MLLKLLSSEAFDRTESAIIILGEEGGLQHKFVDHCRFLINFNPKRRPWQIFRVIKNARSFKPNVIVGWMYWGGIFATFLHFFCPSRLILTVRQSLFNFKNESTKIKFSIKLLALFSRLADNIIYNSRQSINAHRALGFADVSTFIPNGFSEKEYDTDPEGGDNFRQQLGIKKGAKVIALVGRYHECKRHRFFIECLEPIFELFPDLNVLFAGKGLSKAPPELVDVIKYERQRNYFFLGERADTKNLYNGIDILVSPSSIEGFSNVIGEALFCGTGVLVSTAGDSPSLVLNNKNFIFEVDEKTALQKKLIRLLRLDPEGLKSEFAPVISHARRMFRIESVAEEYLKVFKG